MKPAMIRLIIVIPVVAILNSSLAQSLLLNGSFEQPADVGTTNGYAFFPAGSTAIPGWTTVLNGVEYFNPSRASSGTAVSYHGVAEDGASCVDLAPLDYVGGGLQQSFPTTNGSSYEVSFFLGTAAYSGRDGSAHCLATAATATNSFAVTNTGQFAQWVPESFTFTAVSTNTTLTFSTGDDAKVRFVFLDNVKVVPHDSPVTIDLGFYPGIRVNGRIGRSYVVEYIETLTSTNWNQLQYVTLQTSSQFVFDTTSPNRTNRFYRAVELP